ncbi:MAG: S9 family peptidase [Gemmatimonadales bacterium]|nr:S9 family peptidase [Gemmatimonadales bacterium]
MIRRALVTIAAMAVWTGPVAAQQKVPLDHAAYEEWRSIDDAALSPDGQWALYRLTLQDGDPKLHVTGLAAPAEHEVARVASARFTRDSRYVVLLINPELAAVRSARRAGKKNDELPPDTVGVLAVATGTVTRLAPAKSYQVPEESGGWLAYLLVDESVKRDSGAAGDTTGGVPTAARKGKGNTLVVRALDSGAEQRFDHVTEFSFTRDGSRLAFAASGPDSSSTGVWVLETAAGTAQSLVSGAGVFRSLAFDESGTQLAFLARLGAEDTLPHTLFHWKAGAPAAREVVSGATAGLPDGWQVSRHRAPSFSKAGTRLFFGTAPAPAPDVKDTLTDEERVTVEIWHWQDPTLQPMQKLQLRQEGERNYLAMLDLRRDRVTQLATEDLPEITVGRDGDADVALGVSELPYRMLSSWDSPDYRDVYLLDLRSGERVVLLEKTQASPRLSPQARYVAWYDLVDRAWFARPVSGGEVAELTKGIPYPLYDEEHDTPSLPSPYGMAGWTDDDRGVLIYDRFDVWLTDPRGRRPPRAITEGKGRSDSIAFRHVALDRDARAIDPSAPLLFSAFQPWTKAAGFYRDRVEGTGEPQPLVHADLRFTSPIKAREADVLLFTRESVSEFPDLRVTDADFSAPRRISDANPQQSRYRWATVELVEWLSDDGVPLQGLVYKPEDFDPAKQYPLMVNFYERDSDNLHVYHAPVPHRSVIRPVFYASRGYVVFMPDVKYRDGYPGESALEAVVPGVLRLVAQGYVDRERIGIQGHSWGGYQIAYIVTKTNLFRAAGAGATVSNMISAYGGIRWGSGASRMFQYERTQSRIGATLWEAPLRFVENSPIFWADKIETPLLMMANDQDGAVPWYQGIELFVALRRLGKPAWLVNYNGEPHWPVSFAEKRDWNIRMQQFFDHYLMEAPAPVWLERGIPALEKGRTLGLEFEGQRP